MFHTDKTFSFAENFKYGGMLYCLSASLAVWQICRGLFFVGLSHQFTAEFVNVSSYLLKVDYHGQQTEL